MPCHVTCRVLVPWPGIEPRAHQWKPEIPTPRPPGNSPPVCSFKLEWQYFWELPWRRKCTGLSVSHGIDHPVSSFNCGACSVLSCVWHPKSRYHCTLCLEGQGNDCGQLDTKSWWGDLGITHSLQNLPSVVLFSDPLSISSLGGTWVHPQILRHAGGSEACTGLFPVESSSQTSFPFSPWVSISKQLWLSVICCPFLFSLFLWVHVFF